MPWQVALVPFYKNLANCKRGRPAPKAPNLKAWRKSVCLQTPDGELYPRCQTP